MTILFLAILLNPIIYEGRISQYNPGVMERTIKARQNGCCGKYTLPKELPQVAGYVASQERYMIGKTVWIKSDAYGRWEKFLVTDCAGIGDRRESDGLSGYQWMVRYNVIAEVDYKTARRWKTIGKMATGQMMYYMPTPPF